MVFGAVAGGYLMEHGNLRVLMQPAELMIIGGAAVGTVLVANPLHVLKQIVGGLVVGVQRIEVHATVLPGRLKTMYDLFNKARREGLIALESDVEDPEKSPIFSKNPVFLKDHHVRDFVCDTMRMAMTGGIEPFDVDQMMEVGHGGSSSRDQPKPIAALSTMADSLPGTGNCGGGAGGGDHDGRAGRAAGGDRPQGGGGAGGNVSGNSAVLRAGGTGGREHGESGGRGACLLSRAAGGHAGVPEGHVADDGGRSWRGARFRDTCGRHSRKLKKCCEAAAKRRLRRRQLPPRVVYMADAKPIIIIKKNGGHGGHHGGAWKVAYADFVTAMMALFIVLWLLNSSKQVQEAVGGYFKDPTGTSKMVGSNMQGSGGILFAVARRYAEAERGTAEDHPEDR